jgi:hypothetical protein
MRTRPSAYTEDVRSVEPALPNEVGIGAIGYRAFAMLPQAPSASRMPNRTANFTRNLRYEACAYDNAMS